MAGRRTGSPLAGVRWLGVRRRAASRVRSSCMVLSEGARAHGAGFTQLMEGVAAEGVDDGVRVYVFRWRQVGMGEGKFAQQQGTSSRVVGHNAGASVEVVQ